MFSYYVQQRLVITFNSRLHNVTSVKRYVGQSAVSFVRDVAYA